MSRKSLCKSVLRELFPAAFFTPSTVPNKAVTHCIEDALVTLQSYNGEGTGKDLVFFMLRNAFKYHNNTTCSDFILIFDKPGYVPKIKGIEHSKRDTGRIQPAPDPLPGQSLLPLDSPMPYPFRSMLANRRTRQALIKELTHHIRDLFCPGAGKRLIIDGGETQYDPPLVISSVDESPAASSLMDRSDKLNCVRASEELANTVGECDMGFPFYVNAFLRLRGSDTSKNIVVDVITVDTDFIAISLAHFHALEPESIDVRLFLGKSSDDKLAVKQSKDGLVEFKEPVTNVICVRSLFAEVRNKMSRAGLRFPVMNLVAAMLSSGNDYVDGYGGLTPKMVIPAAIAHARTIGDLVAQSESGDWVLQAVNYSILVKSLYYQKFNTHLDKELRKKFRLADDHDWWKEVTWGLLRDKVAIKTPKQLSYRVPTNLTIYGKFLRLSLNILQMTMGCSDPTRIDTVCLDYGYSKKEIDQPLKGDNVRLCTDEELRLPSHLINVFANGAQESLL